MQLFRLGLSAALLALLSACSTPEKQPAPVVSNDGSGQDSALSRGAGQGNSVGGQPLTGVPGDPAAAANAPTQNLVYFDFDASTLRPDARPLVEQHAAYLRAYPSLRVRLEGHADERGSREYNLALGERRALAVSRYLSILGVTPGQIRTHSYGEEMPLAAGHSETSWQQNRRVEFVYE